MEATIKNIESLQNEKPYRLFNRSGVKFNEKYLNEVVLEHRHVTIINGIQFTAYAHNEAKTVFCFSVKMRGIENERSNTSQVKSI
jgi:hypothetical protein